MPKKHCLYKKKKSSLKELFAVHFGPTVLSRSIAFMKSPNCCAKRSVCIQPDVCNCPRGGHALPLCCEAKAPASCCRASTPCWGLASKVLIGVERVDVQLGCPMRVSPVSAAENKSVNWSRTDERPLWPMSHCLCRCSSFSSLTPFGLSS